MGQNLVTYPHYQQERLETVVLIPVVMYPLAIGVLRGRIGFGSWQLATSRWPKRCLGRLKGATWNVWAGYSSAATFQPTASHSPQPTTAIASLSFSTSEIGGHYLTSAQIVPPVYLERPFSALLLQNPKHLQFRKWHGKINKMFSRQNEMTVA